MTSVIDGSRFARAAATRQAIVAAAAALFCEQGYRFVSLREIAARAGISHPALLKHFSGREELLAEVVRRFDAGPGGAGRTGDQGAAGADPAKAPGELRFDAEARRQEATPGYVPFFAALVGEASVRTHPAHDQVRERLAALVERRRAALADALAAGALAEGRDPLGEAIRLTAAWAGLQMLEQYLPGRVDAVGALAGHQALIAHPAGWRAAGDRRPDTPAPLSPALPPLVDEGSAEATAGYRSGRERRAKIVDDAMALFAREGYGDTSLLDIATRVGVSKSALYHHFPSKDALLQEVLHERDRRIDDVVATSPAVTAADVMRGLADGAAQNEAEQPGLIELYAVISSEATPRGHDAHAYFEHRFASALDGFTRMFAAAADAGHLPAHRDPAHEALWTLALWDGLQYLWLYDRDGVDVAGQLRAHLWDALPPSREHADRE